MRSTAICFVFCALGAFSTPLGKQDSRPTISLSKKNNLVQDGVVNFAALRSHTTFLQEKYARTLASYERNTGKPHPSARSLPAYKRQTGSVPLQDDNSVLWYGPIEIGGQKFTVQFDTGSSDLFVPGLNCDSSCDGHSKFDTKGATDTSITFQDRYGDNSSVSGEVYTDSVTIGGLTAKEQAFGVALEYSADFSSFNFPADGLLGMGYPQIAEINATVPLINTLIREDAIAIGEFGFKLADTDSVLYLGDVDQSASAGPLNFIPVTEKGYWQVTMDSVHVNGKTALPSSSAIIDTGTSLIVGNPTSVSQFYESIPGAKDAGSTVGKGYFTYPCDSEPTVVLIFGGEPYDISGTFNLGLSEEGSSECVGGVVGMDTPMDAWVVGDVFLSTVYVEFSFSDNSVGFSRQA